MVQFICVQVFFRKTQKKIGSLVRTNKNFFETCIDAALVSTVVRSSQAQYTASCICLSNRKQVRLGSRGVQWTLGRLLSHIDTCVLVTIYMQAIFSPDQNYACREDDCRASSRSPFFPFVCLLLMISFFPTSFFWRFHSLPSNQKEYLFKKNQKESEVLLLTHEKVLHDKSGYIYVHICNYI